MQQQQHLLQQQQQHERRATWQNADHPQLNVEQIVAQQLMAVQQGGNLSGGATAGAVPLSTGGVADSNALIMDKKQREVYVGNLPIGVMDKNTLEELFNQMLSHMVPDPINAPPVYHVNFDSQGRFGFVEFRTRELANQAMKMDHLIQIQNRHLHINRPKGYVEPTGPPLNLPELSLTPHADGVAGKGTAGNGSGVTGPNAVASSRVILLINCLSVGELRTRDNRDVLQEEVREEASKHGQVEEVLVPKPPENVQEQLPSRVYVRYVNKEDAEKGRKIFHTRTLDDNAIKCVFAIEEEFQLARDMGTWPSRQPGVAGLSLSGLYNITPLVGGVSGLTVLNAALPALVQSNSAIPAQVRAAINEDEVPFEEGYIKLRGFPQSLTKTQIVNFFKDCCPDLIEEDVTSVMSADGTPLGEAFIRLKGPAAKLRLALAKDHSPLPDTQTTAEILTAFEEDMHRRMLAGCQLV